RPASTIWRFWRGWVSFNDSAGRSAWGFLGKDLSVGCSTIGRWSGGWQDPWPHFVMPCVIGRSRWCAFTTSKKAETPSTSLHLFKGGSRKKIRRYSRMVTGRGKSQTGGNRENREQENW